MSYRREETAYAAAWLFTSLANHFGREQVFTDIDSIEPGEDFVDVITTAVESCDVLLALIGRQWLTITDEHRGRRLDNTDDFVRLEIEAALARDVRLIPILVDGARMPRAEELPASLARLARRQAFELSPRRFDTDTQRLLSVLDRTINKERSVAHQELALRYAVRSDVGLVRVGNEDSAYAGPRLLAVADGMGRHAAGKVASSLTIASMAKLDSKPPGRDMLAELSSAVAAANIRLQEMIIANPAVEGIGTTLTALFWSDGHAAVCHIGDSRGYLLREGELYQITHDHTLVQSLVDEGRISADDVSTHPQRTQLLRALDGRSVAEPDLSVHDSQVGDRYLLCTDGLWSVVSDVTLRDVLASISEPEAVARQLIELALHGGGPDNITCIVADEVDAVATRARPDRNPVLAGAVASRRT
jgi:serine/threonine protein phosphatase PrpC